MCQGRVEEALDICVFEVPSVRGYNGDDMELDVMVEEAEGCQHTVALGMERSRVVSVGFSAAFPEDKGVRLDSPSKGAAPGSFPIMGNIQLIDLTD
jgi:hypothetical protein